MRIQPIESPRNPMLRLMYWLMNRQFGKPITPAKVIFTRLPRAIAAQLGIYFGLAGKDGLDLGLKLLLQSLRVADETFSALREHFSDEQIVAITWLNAVENYFNLLNAPLGIESDGLCAIAERRTGRPARAQRTAA
jgi:hypothetical protein